MLPEERYCKRMFRGMFDMREMYEPALDENAVSTDNIRNFKFNPSLPEDVELFNFAFCDRISRIWQNREEYFHGNKALIDLFDCYSNIVFQLHMVELYKDNLKEALGEDYDSINLEHLMDFIKNYYTSIIRFARTDSGKLPSEESMTELTKEFDEYSELICGVGYSYGFPF